MQYNEVTVKSVSLNKNSNEYHDYQIKLGEKAISEDAGKDKGMKEKSLKYEDGIILTLDLSREGIDLLDRKR